VQLHVFLASGPSRLSALGKGLQCQLSWEWLDHRDGSSLWWSEDLSGSPYGSVDGYPEEDAGLLFRMFMPLIPARYLFFLCSKLLKMNFELLSVLKQFLDLTSVCTYSRIRFIGKYKFLFLIRSLFQRFFSFIPFAIVVRKRYWCHNQKHESHSSSLSLS
jgi:hypothetical protein